MLIKRALTALIFAPALLILIWYGGRSLQIACLVLAAIMLWEYLQLTLGHGELYLKAVGFLLGAAVIATTLSLLPARVGSLVPPAAIIVLLTAVLLRPEPIPQSMARAGLIGLGAVYACGLVPYLSLLRELDAGLGLCLMALFCTWAADTGAYFAGHLFGRHKLYPKISPGKTVEGLVGGLAAGVGIAYLINELFRTGLPWWQTGIIGALSALLGVAGDLSESMLKRSVGAKDSSKLIPGHGGFLDRFDAVIFVAPGVYVFKVLMTSLGL